LSKRGKEVFFMRPRLGAFVLGGILLLGTLSCATVPKASVAPGEVRLLSMDALGAGIKANTSFPMDVLFEAVGEPKIQRACFYGLWKDPYCSQVQYKRVGTKKMIQVYLPGVNPGSHRVECYVEYLQDGETRKTNVIATQILVGT
jgi:hypothetical protein